MVTTVRPTASMDLNTAFDRAQQQFKGLNPQEPGQWPLLPKVLSWLATGLLALGLGWVVLVSSAADELEAARNVEPGLKDEIMALYLKLDAYPDVKDALEALRARGKQTAILSNGSPAMLDAAVRHAGLDRLFNLVLSVEDVGIYKPSRRV